MSISDALLSEFDREMATTRRVLERVPDENPDWRPHPKSFPFSHLAQHVAAIPGWVIVTLSDTKLDLAAGAGNDYRPRTTAQVLELFDENVRQAREAILAAKDSDYDVLWSLQMRDHVIYTLPRAAVFRQHMNHLIHHRGQLTVYLRLRDIPVPSVYGPSADEAWG
ncbi:MAG: DinB family protein [Gemmatimonadota bacterium]|jgi:uncharacterized damage-inducible protein DinB|nr:DinB family protein [Gemmatimonadota bacterium]